MAKKQNAFWEELQSNADNIQEEWADLWPRVGATGAISKADAELVLKLMWYRSHLDIASHIPKFKAFYPTMQRNPGRLSKVKNLWWCDHATAGVNGWGTLGWFSSKPRSHARTFNDRQKAEVFAAIHGGNIKEKTKDQQYVVTWRGLACASTHFVVLNNGLPFYIVNIDDGCWGEPKRNGDGIHVEMVNPLKVTRKQDKWYYWAGPIPEHLVKVQHPAELDIPYRGCRHMFPYTWEQVITNIKLKRLCIAATQTDDGPRMARERMSQHTDWRASKLDMGPLWPFDLCNDAAFENFHIADYEFMKQFVNHPDMDPVADPEEVLAATLKAAQDPNTPHDVYDEDMSIDSIKEVQNALVELYGPNALPKYGVDGDMGRETIAAVKRFQNNWNRVAASQPTSNRDPSLLVDGVPGVETCARLAQALLLASNDNFPIV